MSKTSMLFPLGSAPFARARPCYFAQSTTCRARLPCLGTNRRRQHATSSPAPCRWSAVVRADPDAKPSTDSAGLPSAPPLTTTSEGSGGGSSGDGPGGDEGSSERTWRNTVDDIVTIAAALAISLVVRTCAFSRACNAKPCSSSAAVQVVPLPFCAPVCWRSEQRPLVLPVPSMRAHTPRPVLHYQRLHARAQQEVLTHQVGCTVRRMPNACPPHMQVRCGGAIHTFAIHVPHL